MARTQFRGRGALVWCPTVATKGSPTAAEIIAGVKLHPSLTNDGLKTPSKGKTIDIADASDLFDKTAPGAYGGDTGEVSCFRESKVSLDLPYATLTPGATGFLAVSRFGWAQDANGLGSPTGTPTSGDRCEVWPATVIARESMDIKDGAATTFTSAISFPDSPVTDAVVA